MPSNVDKKNNTALETEKIKNYVEARIFCNDILKNNSQDIRALKLLGLIENKEKNFTKAIEYIKKAIGITPSVDLYIDLGRIYIDQNDFYNAIESCKEAIKLASNNYDAWFYLGFSLKRNGQADYAIIAYKRALSLKPDAASVYHNLGNIYDNIKNDPTKTIECYEKFLEYQPENLDAKGCLATLYLKTKRFKEGWELFEYNPNRRQSVLDRNSIPNSPTKNKPIWQGEDITNKTIYVYYNGGYGDTIMFARFLPMLKIRCAKILFRPQNGLIPLFKELNFGTEILDPNSAESDLKFDFHIPLMSLPYGLKTYNEKDIPSANGYICANKEKSRIYKEKYFNNDKFKIGIKWQGDTHCDTKRAFTLKLFYKLFNLPNTKFYSIQVGEGIEQLAQSKDEIVDLGSTFNDFSDTAAAMENIDLIISNDTSVAHLAGAMGKECWAILPFVQDWRWSVDLSYCPWYKSIKLFKQNEIGNWNEVFDRVYEELKNKLIPSHH